MVGLEYAIRQQHELCLVNEELCFAMESCVLRNGDSMYSLLTSEMGSSSSLPLPCHVEEMSTLPIPSSGWPSTQLVNETTEFPVYLIETNTKKALTLNHHQIFVDLSIVYSQRPFDMAARLESKIPFCGVMFHLVSDMATRATNIIAQVFVSEGGKGPRYMKEGDMILFNSTHHQPPSNELSSSVPSAIQLTLSKKGVESTSSTHACGLNHSDVMPSRSLIKIV